MLQARAQWSSFSSYVLVTTGAVVGLGNIFLFPLLVGKFGGLFVLFYLLCELLVSIPILFSELLIGRRGKQNPVGSLSILAMEAKANSRWRLLGWLCFAIAGLTLAYYTVLVAFPLDYFFEAAKALVSNNTPWIHTDLQANLPQLGICFLLFLVATLFVVKRGINRGLEGISRITVPFYFILLIALVIYAAIRGNFLGALAYLVHATPNFTVLQVLFAALTYAFFKLGTGMGTMMVYGSYLPYRVTLGKSTAAIVGLDLIVSFLSYIVIYSFFLVSHQGVPVKLDDFYHAVMSTFLSVPHGELLAVVFFCAAVVAAWTPTIAMAETVCVTLMERCNLSRCSATLVSGVGALILGILIVLSYNFWSNILLFGHWTFYQVIQNLAENVLTPLSALLITFFVGWVVRRQTTANELNFKPVVYSVWRFLICFLAPIVIVLIILGRFIA
jgi:NSS family neurotransmitter:Na+ symporter